MVSRLSAVVNGTVACHMYDGNSQARAMLARGGRRQGSCHHEVGPRRKSQSVNRSAVIPPASSRPRAGESQTISRPGPAGVGHGVIASGWSQPCP